MRKTSVEAEDLVISLYKEGIQVQEVAKQAGVNPATVYTILKRNSVPKRGATQTNYSPTRYIVHPPGDIWAAEFRGLFYADGCAKMVRTNHVNKAGKQYYLYRPELSIQLRADNADLLEEIADCLGGYCYRVENKRPDTNSKPTVNWVLTGYPKCGAVIEATALNSGLIPARKVEDVSILYEAILARYKMPHNLTDEDREILNEYYMKLKEVKRYKGSGD